MEFIVLLIIVIVVYLILRFIFDFNVKKIKELGEDKELDKLTQKYPENVEICKWYLKKLKNENVKIEEDKNSNATLYLVMSNKIFIANLKESYTRIQTIAHECLHSIQSKKLLWFNFIFSNVYLVYFGVICILALLKILPMKMTFLSIFIVFSLVYYAVRTYLENDAMVKAKYVAEDYMKSSNLLTDEEITHVLNKYEEINKIGVKLYLYRLILEVLIRTLIFSIICIF